MMNDETEQFESRLSSQPLKQIPAAWRAEILTAARGAQPSRRLSPVTRHPWLSTINSELSTVFWMRDTSPRVVEKSATPSPEVMVELKKQQRLFAELVGANEPLDADRQKLFAPKPRSECVEILMT